MSVTVQNSLPNPFTNSVDVVMPSMDTVAAAMPHCPQAAAVPFSDFQGCDSTSHPRASLPATAGRKAGTESFPAEGPVEAPAVTAHHSTAAGVTEPFPRGFDVDAFMAELADETVREMLKQQMPVFLRAPRPEFLQATTGE